MKNNLNKHKKDLKEKKINSKKFLTSSIIWWIALSWIYMTMKSIDNNDINYNKELSFKEILHKNEHIYKNEVIQSNIKKFKNIENKSYLSANENVLLNNFDNLKFWWISKSLNSKIKKINGIKYFKKNNEIHVIMEKSNGRYLDKKNFNNTNKDIHYYNNYIDFYYKSMDLDIENIDFVSYLMWKMTTITDKTNTWIKIIKLNFKDFWEIEKKYYWDEIEKMIENSNWYIIK